MPSTYQVHNNEKLFHFEIKEGANVGFMEYRFQNQDIALMHTEVPAKMEGKGIASALADYAFKYAEEQKKRVIIYCPFVMNYLKKHPELQSLLANGSDK